jgi:hypothetical protein
MREVRWSAKQRVAVRTATLGLYGLVKLPSFEGRGRHGARRDEGVWTGRRENEEEDEHQRHRTQRAGNPDGDEQSGGRDGHGTIEKGGAGPPLPRLRFTRHLLEMVVAMFAGMAVLGVAL